MSGINASPFIPPPQATPGQAPPGFTGVTVVGNSATNQAGDTLTRQGPTTTVLLQAPDGSTESISQDDGGDASVSQSDGTMLSAKGGQLYGQSPDGSAPVALGSVNDPDSYKQAVSQGFATQQGAQDLMNMQNGSLSGLSDVQQQFGGDAGTADGVNQLEATLGQQAPSAGSAGAGPPDPSQPALPQSDPSQPAPPQSTVVSAA